MRTLAFCLCLGALCLSTTATAQPIADLSSRGTIRVTGTAEIRVIPDEVVLRLGVETFDPALAQASAQNEAAVAAVTSVARAQGVADAHIQTDHIGIEPLVNTWRNGGPPVYEVYGYRVRRTVVISLRDLERFDALLREAIAAGATNVHGVTFQTTDLRTHRDQARALAVDAAREKAEAMAGRLGQRLGPPTHIIEEPEWWGGSYGSGWGAAGGGALQNVVQSAPGDGSGGDVLSPGELAVRARVAITFALDG